MTQDELRDQLRSHKQRAQDLLDRIKSRPHPNYLYNVSAEFAALELRHAAVFWAAYVDNAFVTKEIIKAYLAARYAEFIRCEAQLTYDDVAQAAEFIVYGFVWLETYRGGEHTILYTRAYQTYDQAQNALRHAVKNAPSRVGDDQEREFSPGVSSFRVDLEKYRVIAASAEQGKKVRTAQMVITQVY